MNVLVVIPARGGSEGIARKNLRSLGGRPLISHSIGTALASSFKPDVYVSSDDEEILSIAAKYGAKPCKRNKELADSVTTLDPVIYHAYRDISASNNKDYSLIVTLQPTSPLLTTASLDAALKKMVDESPDTIISAKDDTHLTWRREQGQFKPNFTERVNRQQLTPAYRETGGFLICKQQVISENNRIGDNVTLYLLSGPEAIDIDTYEDFNLCEYYLKQKTILFVLTGHHQVGLGHVYRALTLANRIVDHKLVFFLDKDSQLGYDKVKESKHRAVIQRSDNMVAEILALQPEIVINDHLDTEDNYMLSLKEAGLKVVNFEDLGSGADKADLVINDLYPPTHEMNNVYSGPGYFCARDEFLIATEKRITGQVNSVLLTFGGTDTNNLTAKVLDAIHSHCAEKNIQINVVLGLGYQRLDSLEAFEGIQVHQNIKNMSDFMLEADIIFTSAGRTIYEIACIGTPAIVFAQNQRETTHFWASEENGYQYLGLGADVNQEKIFETFSKLVDNLPLREKMNKTMLSQKIRQGTPEVIRLIRGVIECC